MEKYTSQPSVHFELELTMETWGAVVVLNHLIPPRKAVILHMCPQEIELLEYQQVFPNLNHNLHITARFLLSTTMLAQHFSSLQDQQRHEFVILKKVIACAAEQGVVYSRKSSL